jgi:dynein heavy chain
LVKLLGGEAERWKKSADVLSYDLNNLTGNIILSAASIAYLGPFNFEYRTSLIKTWAKDCMDAKIPVSEDFNL